MIMIGKVTCSIDNLGGSPEPVADDLFGSVHLSDDLRTACDIDCPMDDLLSTTDISRDDDARASCSTVDLTSDWRPAAEDRRGSCAAVDDDLGGAAATDSVSSKDLLGRAAELRRDTLGISSAAAFDEKLSSALGATVLSSPDVWTVIENMLFRWAGAGWSLLLLFTFRTACVIVPSAASVLALRQEDERGSDSSPMSSVPEHVPASDGRWSKSDDGEMLLEIFWS